MRKEVLIFVAQVVIIAIILICYFVWGCSLARITPMESMMELADPIIDSDRYSSTLEINSTEEWLKFADAVNNGQSYRNCLVVLNADLDFSSCGDIRPVGNEASPFQGTLLGNGYSLSNITMICEEEYAGVFGFIQDATIMDLNVANCKIENSKESRNSTGGIVGYASSSIIYRCSFQGDICAPKGSSAGIVGSNYSTVDLCTSKSKSTGAYNGGIVGINYGAVTRCRNYGDDTSAGIVGTNYGAITFCVNFGNVTGGGIATITESGSSIYGCFNLGKAYAGISRDATARIRYCVNLGDTSGRYAGDIVSWGGTSTGGNIWEWDVGEITSCLYVNSSGAGVMRKDYFEESVVMNNYRVFQLSSGELAQLTAHLEEGNYTQAYEFVVEAEIHRRNSIFIALTIAVVLLIILPDFAWIYSIWSRKSRLYQQALKYKQQGMYQKAYLGFCRVLDYRDSYVQALSCIKVYISQCTDTIQLGKINESPITWVKLRQSEDACIFLAQDALTVDAVHSAIDTIMWRDSDLWEKLNVTYKKQWLNEIEQEIIVDISIPTWDDVLNAFPCSAQRRCKPVDKSATAVSKNGYVFWWVLDENLATTSRMSFITPDGLVNRKGKNVTATQLAVRPTIEVKTSNES